jgi:tight adherence protein B
MMIIVISALVFVAVVLLVVGVTLRREGAAAKELGDRLKSLGFGGRDAPELDAQRDSRYSSMPWFDRILRSLNIGQNLELLIYQAGMTMRPGVVILMIAAFAMGGYFLGIFFMHRVLPGLLFMLVAAPLPYLYIVNRKAARMKAFAHEFPDALDLLVSGLRAGLSFTAAMQIVAEESPDPVRGEFAITVEEQALGIDFREALVNLTKRVDSLDLRFFVTAVLLQRDTGGNLAEILHNTAVLIRDRFRILGDIQTFTAQGRLTGAILSALPIGMALYMLVIAPNYFRPMLEAHTGRVALGVAAFLQLLGYLTIQKIVKIKV